jgi:hypothetical protein
LFFKDVEGLAEIRRHVLAALRPLEQHAEVVDFPGQAVSQLEVLGKTALPLQGFLGLRLVVPETGRGDLLF